MGTVLADPAAKVTGRSAVSGYLVRVQPLHRELMHAEGRAKQIVQQYAQEFCPSGAACRMLRVNPRMLGRLTGNVWVDDSRGERVDIGLAVKNAKQGLCVPCELDSAVTAFGDNNVAHVDVVASGVKGWLQGLGMTDSSFAVHTIPHLSHEKHVLGFLVSNSPCTISNLQSCFLQFHHSYFAFQTVPK